MNITFAGHHVLGKYIVSDPLKHIVQQDKDRAYEEAPDTTALDLGNFVWLEWTRSYPKEKPGGIYPPGPNATGFRVIFTPETMGQRHSKEISYNDGKSLYPKPHFKTLRTDVLISNC